MEVFMGKSSINGPFSMAMLNNQRVYIIKVGKTYVNEGIVQHAMRACSNLRGTRITHELLNSETKTNYNIYAYHCLSISFHMFIYTYVYINDTLSMQVVSHLKETSYFPHGFLPHSYYRNSINRIINVFFFPFLHEIPL